MNSCRGVTLSTERNRLCPTTQGRRRRTVTLLETFALAEVHGAIGDALRLGAVGYDAVKHLVLCRVERRPPRLDLDVYPYLPRARVTTTSAASYMSLLSGAAP